MNKFILTCCSTADRPKEFFENRSIYYAQFHFMMNEVNYPDDLGETIPFNEFYKAIRNGAAPVTSQVNSEEFTALWEPFLADGNDILHITLSSGISGVYNSAHIAMEALAEKYPERTIKVVDSLGASSGYGLLMEYLADMRDAGESLETLYNWIEQNKLHMHHWFFSTDLTSYKRGGRITAAQAAIGTILGVCPLMNMDNLGRLIPRTKIRTKKKVIEEIVTMMELHATDGINYSGKCTICQSDCLDDAVKVKALVEQKFPNLKNKVTINNIGTVIGSHTGPGTIALFFMGDERTE